MSEQDYFQQFVGDEPDIEEPQPWHGTIWYLHPDGMYRPYAPMLDYTLPKRYPIGWDTINQGRALWRWRG